MDKKIEKKIRINDLKPTESFFSLLQAKGKTFKLRPCTVGMLSEMNESIGDIERMIAEIRTDDICKMALFLMNHEDAMFFKLKSIKYLDIETGEEKEKNKGGFKLLRDLISNVDEHFDIYSAVLYSIGHDKEMIDNIVGQLKNKLKDVVNNVASDKLKKKIMNH